MQKPKKHDEIDPMTVIMITIRMITIIIVTEASKLNQSAETSTKLRHWCQSLSETSTKLRYLMDIHTFVRANHMFDLTIIRFLINS